MKRLILFAIVTLFLSLNLEARTADPDTTLTIKFEKLIYDYGTITEGGNGTCEYVFSNTGNTPLILNNVTASCGCTVPEWTHEPVQPGKTGIIKIKYNTNIVGTFVKTVIVISNAKNSPVILTIKGNVIEK